MDASCMWFRKTFDWCTFSNITINIIVFISKIKKFQQRFFHFENLADQLDNVMYNIDGDPSSGLDDWGVGCFVDFVSYMDRPPANYSHKAVWVSDAKDYMKLK